jgi:uncharacterized protein (DUF58 family)
MRPTGRALLIAAAGLPVALLPAAFEGRLWPVWAVFALGFVAALAAEALLLPRPSRVSAEVELPATLYIGEEDAARLTVRVPGPGAVTVMCDLSERLAAVGPLRALAADGAARFVVPLRSTRRGRVAVERVWVRVAGPLGLLERTAVRQLGTEAVVVPNTLPVRATALRFAAERDFRAGLKIEGYRGDGTELDSLREHSRGDDSRAIDWKASAHHLKLVSRQYRAERNHQIVCAVDTGRLMCEPLAGIPKLDHAVTAALLLCYVSLKAGDRVGLLGFDAGVGTWVEPRGGLGAYQTLARMASRLDYSDAETNFTLGLTALAQRLRRRSLVVVLTDFVDTVAAELMLENLSRLAARHVVVFVALQDPGLAGLAAAAPATVLQLNRAVVAAGLLRDREVVLRDLRRRGIHALDAAPAAVRPQLINTYLEIKRRERIS